MRMDKCPNQSKSNNNDPVRRARVTDLTETSRDELKLLLNEFKFANNCGIVALLSSHGRQMRILTAEENVQDYLVGFWTPDPALPLVVSPSWLIGNTKPSAALCKGTANKRFPQRERERERGRQRERERPARQMKKSKGRIIPFTKTKRPTSFSYLILPFPSFWKLSPRCRWDGGKRRLAGKRRWPSCVSLVPLFSSKCVLRVWASRIFVCLRVCARVCVCVYVFAQRLSTPLHCSRPNLL